MKTPNAIRSLPPALLPALIAALAPKVDEELERIL